MSIMAVTTMCGSRADAEKIADVLIERRAAACVQISGPVTSVYRWKGKVEKEQEWRCTAKTKADLLQTVETVIKSLHSYELPEISVLRISGGSGEYLRWIEEETSR
ncbi:MAG: divalent-cation tolerance protein CutA [Spirochaetes bacterium]|nr:divalent-cation tolerance protein CutA [Spirochaetota bacterium]